MWRVIVIMYRNDLKVNLSEINVHLFIYFNFWGFFQLLTEKINVIYMFY